MSLLGIACIGLGGAFGAIVRALAGRLIVADFPFATLLVNVAGSFLLAAATAGLPESSELARLAIGSGFCGALTTFSTFILEAVLLFRTGHHGKSLLYVMATIVLCCLASWVGFHLMA